MPIRMKEIEDSEIDGLVSFRNLSYGDKRTQKQWLWEYKGNYPDLAVFTILKDDDKIVGSQGMIPIYLCIKGETWLSGKSESSLLDPNYRGGERFKELYDLAISLCQTRKMVCVWGFTSAVKVLRHKLNFSVYEDVIYKSMLILKPLEFVSSTKSKMNTLKMSCGTMLLYLYSSIRGFAYKHLKRSQKTVSIEEKPKSISDIDELYERLRIKYANVIYIRQDEKYVAWRVFNNPNVKYMPFFAYKNGVLGAYCYVALTNNKEAYLSDLTFDDHETGNFLLRTILDLIHERDVNVVYFIGNIQNPLIGTTFNLLSKYGFVKRKHTPFVLKNISYTNEEYLYNVKNWYINGLWTEGYLF
jgi:hypothetical protein